MTPNESTTGSETPEIMLALVKKDVEYIRDELKAMRGRYVTQEEMRPIKMLVYGGVAIALTAIIGALLAQVVPGAG